MSDKNFKTIRKQLRQVVQEILPEVFTEESVKSMEKVLILRVDNHLSGMAKEMKDALEAMDRRSQDIQNYVVRNVGLPQVGSITTAESPKNDAGLG